MVTSNVADGVEIRPIPGLEGYFAGSDGTIWSAWKKGCPPGKRGGGSVKEMSDRLRLVKGRPHVRSGHIEVRLRDRMKFRKVHQLVLLAFVGPRPEGMDTRHLNGNPADNRLENICYGTRRENIADAIRHGAFCGFRKGVTHGGRKAGGSLIAFGEEKSLRGWSQDSRCVVSYQGIWWRTQRLGMDIESALTTPAMRKRKTKVVSSN